MGRFRYKQRPLDTPRVHARLEAARRCQQSGDWKQTEVLCKGILEAQPDQSQALYLAASAALELGRAEEAAQLLRQGIQTHPELALFHGQLGTTLRVLGRLDEAVESYQRALSLTPDDADHYSNLGNVLREMGLREEALACYRQGLELQPGHAVLHHNLAVALHELGRIDEAIGSYRRAVGLQPDFVDSLNNLANLLRESGQRADAVEYYRKLVEVKPDLASAHLNLGVTLQNEGRLDEAAAAYKKVLELQPEHAGAANNLGNLLRLQEKLPEAKVWLERALTLDPTLVLAHNNLGALLQAEGDTDRALAEFERAIELAPDDAVGYNNASNVFCTREDFGRAEEYLRKATALRPDFAEAYNNLGNVLRNLNRFDDAVETYRRAVELSPTLADAHSNLGNGLKDLGQFDEAIACYQKALELSPNSAGYRWNKALTALTVGDLTNGWLDYEAGFACKQRAPWREFPQPRWEGQSLTGKTILAWGEQGVGDELMFANAIPDLADAADHCVVECDSRLVPLYARSFPDCEVLARTTPAQPRTGWPDIDWQTPVGSLPRWLRPTVDCFPRDRGYLAADPARVGYWRERLAALGPGMKVGISWKSRVMTANRVKLCVRLEECGALLQTPGVQFINLQYCNWAEDIVEAERVTGVHVHHFEDLDLKDALDDVSALVCALDLTITISNIFMTLAGGLNAPAWVFAMQDHMDWLTLGTDYAPWFPGVRLFNRTWRQTWSPVLEAMAGELKELARR